LFGALSNILLVGDKGFDMNVRRKKLWAQIALRPFHRGPADVLLLGIISRSIASGTR
jgi:hypothetical protein